MNREVSPYVHTQARGRRLRTAVLVPAHRADITGLDDLIADLRAADFIDVAAVYFFEDSSPNPSPGALVRAYRAFDELTSGSRAPAATVEGIHVTFEQLAGELEQQSAGGTAIDVLICPIYLPALRELSHLAREGLWWQSLAGSQPAPVAYFEALRNTAMGAGPVCISLWAFRPGQTEPQRIMSGSVRQVSSFSVELNLASLQPLRRHLWMASLRRLSVRGAADENEDSAELEPPATNGHAPDGPLDVARWISSMTVRHIGQRMKRRGMVEEWRVGWRPRAAEGAGFADPDGYRWIDADDGYWFADPHIVTHQGRDWLFLEEFDKLRGKGHISCVEMGAAGPRAKPQVVLDLPYHLSYPHVFEHGGEMFMIPESGFNNTIELFRAVEFPFRWERVRVLHRGPAFDTVVCQRDGRFWFFTSLVEGATRIATQFLLFSSERIDGDWEMHPCSPLTFDSRWARSAGPLFVEQGRLIRPAQDCSVEYGGALCFREVTALDAANYSENTIGQLLPGIWPNTIGVHTYGRTARIEVIDRLVMRRVK